MKNFYKSPQYKQLVNSIVILHDTKEQNNQHILEYFDKNKINHEAKSLKTGDYCFKIPACQELGFNLDAYFTDELCIERKNSIGELAGNLCEKDDRFFKELNRMSFIENNYLLIENDKIDDILSHKYRSKLNELSFFRTLLTIQKKCNLRIQFVNQENMGFMIYEICLNILNNKILK